MSKETVKAQIDIDITNKTSSKSISPLNVGQNMKNVVDLIPDSGGTQDLQSVLDNGTRAEFSSGNNYIDILSQTDPLNSFVEWYVSDGSTDHSALYSGIGQFNFENQFGDNNGKILIHEGNPEMYINNLGKISRLIFDTPISSINNFHIPAKLSSGDYVLATLDDIKKIDLTGRVYANNAAAITGGLTANDVYRTSTGELRIVV